MADLVEIEITKPLPVKAVAESTYKIEGSVKLFGAVGAPPFVYAQVRRKEWWKPEWIEEKDYLRGWPVPITGGFTIEFTPEKESHYEVKVVATPAPLSLPAIGVFPTLAESDVMMVEVGEEPSEDFTLARPTVSQTPVTPGTTIDITCPVTSKYTEAVEARAKVIIYEGSILPLHGTKIKEYDSDVFHLEPNETKDVIIHHTTVNGTNDRRDVGVKVYVGGKEVASEEWDDVFHVPEEEVDFDMTRPTATPAEATPGQTVTISCPITSKCTEPQTITAKVRIYEGSILPTHGTLIATKTSPAFTIEPGQSYEAIVHHTAVAGTIDRRDVGVDIYVGTKHIKGLEWDDVFHVPEEEVDFDMTRPTATPAEATPGQTVTISCPITSKCTEPQTITAKVRIYEGSILPTHGTLIATKTSAPFIIEPGQAMEAIVQHTTVAGTIDRRDVGVDIYIGTKHIKGLEWDDVYHVKEEAVDFTIGDLTVTPQEGPPGTNFELKFAVTNNSGVPIQGEIEVLIRQGEWLAPGVVLDTKTAPLILAGGQTGTITLHHVGQKTYTGDDEENERDVDVNIYVAGELVAERDWRYGEDGFIFGIIEVPKLAVDDVTVSPLSGDRWTNFNIVTNVYNASNIQQTFDLQIDIVIPPFLGIVDTKYYQGIIINPNTVLPVSTTWVAYGIVDAGSYRVNAKVIVNGECIANKMSNTFEVISPTVGSFTVAPYSWPDLFPYPEATEWGVIWTTPEGAFSSGILPKSQLVQQFEDIPLTGQLTMIFYAPGYHETFGPTAQVTLEDGAAYWYHWTNNTLVKS